jgi:hypothetical protein
MMDIKAVETYLASSSKVRSPFFLFVGDADYKSVQNELLQKLLVSVPMSQFCGANDRIPSVDTLEDYIRMSDIDASGKKFFITGLGEYLAFCGQKKADEILLRLFRFNVGGSRVVLLLRGVSSQINTLKADKRFDERCYKVVGNAECDLSFTFVTPTLKVSQTNGLKAILETLEAGHCGNIVASTTVDFSEPMFNIKKINSAYEGVKFKAKEFSLSKSCGNDEQWMKLMSELADRTLAQVFENYRFDVNVDSDFAVRIRGSEYQNWLYFIFLKYNTNTVQNNYLRFVLEKTNDFESFVSNTLKAIIDIKPSDKRFSLFYQERKVLVAKFKEYEIADFINNNGIVPAESVYRLTDNSAEERKAIISWIAQNGVVKQIADIYPHLGAYLKQYVFKCPDSELADLLTRYFDDYKRQKVTNVLDDNFVKWVDELAEKRVFTSLPSRNEVLDGVDKNETSLYWLDALGVEYLSIIERLVKERGLSMNIKIAQAELPTITTTNNSFYYNDWKGHKYEKNEELDEVKHKAKGGYSFIDNKSPVHLAKELEIINNIIGYAATELGLRKCKRFLIVSDHGASRLAVLRNKEERYETDTKGEHSGRCCKIPPTPYDLPFAAEESGYLVLADYGIFKGGRKANVEVHGGASLEEVVIPIIELSLKDSSVTVRLVNDTVIVDRLTGAVIELFFNTVVQSVSVVVEGKSYSAIQTTDTRHYKVNLPTIKKSGTYQIDVYVGDNLIEAVTIKAQGKSAKVDSDFDDLF